MQTFLPHPQFERSAAALDSRRLNKQIVEAEQIVTALENPAYGWRHHPAVQMWRGYRDALVAYGCACYDEWQRRLDAGERGGKREHRSGERLRAREVSRRAALPPWLGDYRLHSSHRACLLAKSPHYLLHGWIEAPAPAVGGKWPYWWPITNEEER